MDWNAPAMADSYIIWSKSSQRFLGPKWLTFEEQLRVRGLVRGPDRDKLEHDGLYRLTRTVMWETSVYKLTVCQYLAAIRTHINKGCPAAWASNRQPEPTGSTGRQVQEQVKWHPTRPLDERRHGQYARASGSMQTMQINLVYETSGCRWREWTQVWLHLADWSLCTMPLSYLALNSRDTISDHHLRMSHSAYTPVLHEHTRDTRCVPGQ